MVGLKLNTVVKKMGYEHLYSDIEALFKSDERTQNISESSAWGGLFVDLPEQKIKDLINEFVILIQELKEERIKEEEKLAEQKVREEALMKEALNKSSHVMVFSGSFPPGYKMTRYGDFISYSISRNVVEIRDVLDKSSVNHKSPFDMLIKEALQELKIMAALRGCNVIIGLDFDSFCVSNRVTEIRDYSATYSMDYHITATGTAINVIEEDN